jgi:small nuclear ribonucleoprotein (snRNP)-like protein
VNLRSNRKLLGRIKAFDRHMNLVMENVKEIWTEFPKKGFFSFTSLLCIHNTRHSRPPALSTRKGKETCHPGDQGTLFNEALCSRRFRDPHCSEPEGVDCPAFHLLTCGIRFFHSPHFSLRPLVIKTMRTTGTMFNTSFKIEVYVGGVRGGKGEKLRVSSWLTSS